MARKTPSSWPEPLPEAEALVCALCEREVSSLTQHHLTPVLQGKRRGLKVQDLPTVGLCAGCHGYVHTTFSNHDLDGPYSSLEALQEHEGVTKFVAWVRKQPVGKAIKVK